MKKQNKEKIDKGLKENAQLLMSSFQHMHDTRERIIQNRVNFLLLVATFLPILSITMYSIETFRNVIILIPIIFQFGAIITLLKEFFVRGNLLHWAEHKSTLRRFIRDDFYERLFFEMKGLEKGTKKSMDIKYKKIVLPALFLIIMSLFALVLAVICIYLELNFRIFTILLLFTIIVLFLAKFHFKPIEINTNPFVENYREKYTETLDRIEKEVETERKQN